MNERIRQLAKQAYLYQEDDNFLTAALENFAELIVEECAQDFDKTYMTGGETVGNYIRRKFGVAENL
jgi:hypothetical protein